MFSYIIRDCNSATEHISMDTGDLEINILKFINNSWGGTLSIIPSSLAISKK